MAANAPPDTVQRIVSVALDAAFYRTVNAEDAEAVRDPLQHYMRRGWREQRDPAPWFSVRRYLEAYPEIAKSDIDPFLHYLRDGRREGRDVFPSDQAADYFAPRLRAGEAPAWSLEALFEPGTAAAEGLSWEPTPEERALIASAFDVEFYLDVNRDVGSDGVDPLEHFLEHGWREGRDPSARFSINDYLEHYPDIARAKVNPFLHYLRTGRGEGRKARHELGFRYDILAQLRPIEGRFADAAARAVRVKPLPGSTLAATLAKSRSGLKAVHLTISHDDYSTNMGGVQLCLQREEVEFAELGFDHLHLYPANPWPMLRIGERPPLGVLWNGRPAGVYGPRTIAKVLRETIGAAERRTFAIHGLIGHSIDDVLDILGAFGQSRGFFWLHDFASLCGGYHLMRNDVEECSAPPPESAGCGICLYGPSRGAQLAEWGKLFEALQLTVVSPADGPLDFWRGAWRFPISGERVHAHAVLQARGAAPAVPKRPLRVAFPAMPVIHKGWPVFRELTLRFDGDPRYEFTHVGGRQVKGLPMGFQGVMATPHTPFAMKSALEEIEADVALVWSLCRETFSFVAYEAAAAGAAVVTSPDSGNVAAFVEAHGHGRVLADEIALFDAFASGEILKLARTVRRPQLYDLQFSRMTADLIGAEVGA